MRAAAALITRLLGEFADNGDGTGLGERQHTVRILQQHHALPCHHTCQRMMLISIKGGILPAALHAFENKAQHPFHSLIQSLHGQLAAVHRVYDLGIADPAA
ncbi:hypothetical protein D3C75_936810 [compost metagenome]